MHGRRVDAAGEVGDAGLGASQRVVGAALAGVGPLQLVLQGLDGGLQVVALGGDDSEGTGGLGERVVLFGLTGRGGREARPKGVKAKEGGSAWQFVGGAKPANRRCQ